ncbi:MAG: SpoIIE family protein phosphatase [Leptospiraceae bacterium]|nr:SpoIIE family protein phosphatase [Leptospiraceae bacterium]
MPELFYLNFFSLGATIPAIFMFSAGYFLIMIKQRRPATTWLLGAFISLGFFNLAYALPTAVYHEALAWHRVATATMVMIALFCLQQFLMLWHKSLPGKVRLVITVLQAAVMIASTVDFIWHVTATPVQYNFRSMLWDFTDFAASKRFGLVLIANFFVAYGTGLWKAWRFKRVRWAALGVTLGIFVATIVPGVVNVLSRDGLMSRDIYQLTLDTSYVLGWFMVLIIFVNVAKESTTFMARIIAISMALFLLVMTPVSYFAVDSLAGAWQNDHLHQSKLALQDSTYRPVTLRYIAWLPNSAVDAIQWRYRSNPDFQVDNEILSSLEQSLGRYHMKALLQVGAGAPFPTPQIEARLAQYQSVAPHPQRAWIAALRFILDANSGLTVPNSVAAMRQLDSIANRVAYTRTKMSQLPPRDFRASAKKLLKGESKGAIASAFMQQAASELDALPATSDAELQKTALRLLSPLPALGRMLDRYNTAPVENRDHFSVFHIAAPDGSGMYEVGWSHLSFRKSLHTVTINLFWVLISASLVIMVLFRFFFFGSLIQPLNRLIEGVRQVNQGKLDVDIELHVEDEIGFLTRSFNGMVDSIRTARQKLQDYADQLEDKVSERTRQLQNTLEEVQSLKHQQDGDYFLTALLTHPLGRNQVESSAVTVDFVLSQKKQFSFRNRSDEIGGDLCKAHDIRLRDRDCVVVLNADAMGKSIQGAGGVLVLGSVFESMINRTQGSSAAQAVYPERWLKNAFLELHKVFESFDGSMLISVVLGLLDCETGFFYYMNAEHPATVLYRNSEASFIDEDMLFRKLGTQGVSGKLQVQTLQLQVGDVLIAGSDGRDDLLLGEDAVGNRRINEDEFLFLDLVRETRGDIHKIPGALKNHGELTDDLSLLRLEYLGNRNEKLILDERTITLRTRIHQAIQTRDHDAARAILDDVEPKEINDNSSLREIALFYNHQEDYTAAARWGCRYVERNPADTEMIYRTSLILKRIRNLEGAADLAERIRLRQPTNTRNLIHLADIYISLSNWRRARKIISTALELESENPKALRVLQYIEDKTAPATN